MVWEFFGKKQSWNTWMLFLNIIEKKNLFIGQTSFCFYGIRFDKALKIVLLLYNFWFGFYFANDVKINVDPVAYFYHSHHFGFGCKFKITDV